MKNLIINADDFGLHREVNKAISIGHAKGSITSTSLMAMGSAFNDAVNISRQQPTLGIGVHLTLVAAKSILPAVKIPSLVDSAGSFLPNHVQFITKYLRGQIKLTEIYLELQAQIERVKAAGIKITHLDSHQHLHVLPAILKICLVLAKEHDIKAMRIPAEAYTFTGGYPLSIGRLIGKSGLTFLARNARKKANQAGIYTPEHFFGMLAGGHLSERYLLNILKTLPEGTSEIMMHPGSDITVLNSLYNWHYQWNEELKAVMQPSILNFLQANNIKLRSFREFNNE